MILTPLPTMHTKEDEIFNELLAHVSKKTKELRHQKGYSSYESFAFDHELPRAQYWRLERGKDNITLRSIAKIIAIHNITIDQFFK